MNDKPTVPAIVCTLKPKELATRRLEWSDLSALAVSFEQLPNGVASSYPLELRDDIEDLVDRERSCCGSWMDSALGEVHGLLRLELTTSNPDGVAVIHAMTSTAD